MDLNVADLAAQGLDLSWDGPRGAERRVSLAPSEGVTGRYAISPDEHRLDAATDRELVIAGVTWPLIEGGIRVTGDAPLSRLAVDLVIPRGGGGGTEGEVGVGAMSVPAVEVELPSLDGPLRLAGLAMLETAMAFDGKGGLAVVADGGELDRLVLSVGGTEVALEGIALQGIKARRHEGAWAVQIATATAEWLRIETGSISLKATKVTLRRLGLRGSDVTLGNLGAAQVELRHPELGQGAEPAETEEPAEPEAERAPLDLAALDRLNGKIDVDVTADTTAPIIGGRRATHHFRLRVDHGAINYHRLEKSLSKLEDALLDFRVKDRRLLLLADVPFMPLSKKTLVSWPLPDAEELALAAQHLVRLRRLFDYRLPNRGSEAPTNARGRSVHPKAQQQTQQKNAKKSFEVRELRFDGIDVELRLSGGDRVALPAGGAILLGAPNRPAIGELGVTGAVRYTAAEAPAGALDIRAERLRMGLEQMAVGSRRLDLDRLSSDEVRARIDFAGLRPTSLVLELIAPRLRDLTLRAAPSP